MSERINLVFMGGFTYPRGMAGTKRIQNAINALKEQPEMTIRVLLQRQSAQDNPLSGVHEGIPYETVMGDLLRAKMLVALPLLCRRTAAALKELFLPGHSNVIYFYGPLSAESVLPLSYAKGLGYKIVFDIVEDYDLARGISRSLCHQIRVNVVVALSSVMLSLADGLVLISSHLEKKYRMLTKEKVPLHYMPISVDMGCFPGCQGKSRPVQSLLYAGSFGMKDGLPVLFDAFDKLAQGCAPVRLVLTGRGDRESIRKTCARIEASPHRESIEFKGYLEDKEYYSLLNDADIPCMTRVDLAYAHAGLPFKLGEFLATGKPVIASRVSDVERFLVDRHNAMLVEAGSSAQICEAVRFLIANPESGKSIGARGREVAESFFDYRRQGKALFSFLASL